MCIFFLQKQNFKLSNFLTNFSIHCHPIWVSTWKSVIKEGVYFFLNLKQSKDKSLLFEMKAYHPLIDWFNFSEIRKNNLFCTKGSVLKGKNSCVFFFVKVLTHIERASVSSISVCRYYNLQARVDRTCIQNVKSCCLNFLSLLLRMYIITKFLNWSTQIQLTVFIE